MSAVLAGELEPRPHKIYTTQQFEAMFVGEGMAEQNPTYLVAIDATVLAGDPGTTDLIYREAVDFRVLFTDESASGVVTGLGVRPIIVLNNNDVVDYDRISGLHPIQSAAAYILLTDKYGSSDAMEIESWWRCDYYADDDMHREKI